MQIDQTAARDECAVKLTSDGVLSLHLADEVIRVPLSQVQAQHLARGLLQYAAPEAYAARTAATSRHAGHA